MQNAYCHHAARGVIKLTGPDRRSLLQGLITNDINRLDAGALYTAWLSPHGKFLYDFMAFEQQETLYITPEKTYIDEILKKLRLYKLRSQVVIELLDEWGVFITQDPTKIPGTFTFQDPRHAELGYIVLGPQSIIEACFQAHPLPSMEMAGYQAERYKLGIPEGAFEIGYDKGILLENGFDEMGAISWDKGCYMGQELTARTKHRGMVRKRILPIQWQGPTPVVGDKIYLGDAPAGFIRALLIDAPGHDRGLAMIRLEPLTQYLAQEGQLTLKSGTKILPTVPDWMHLPQES